MASIRRALSPANPDRSHQNGGVGFSSFVPESKQSQSQASLALPTFSHSRFLASVVVQRRRGLHGWWQQLFFRLTLLFFLGFLLGMVATFGDSQNGRNKNSDPPFEIEAQPLRINKETVDFEMNAERLSIPVMETIDYALRKQLIVVTPTYNRAVQAFYLNRLGQLLRLVPPPLLWIVVETKVASPETSEILRSTGVIYRHLVCNRSSSTFKDRGIHQRNTALEHIEHHRLNGIVYFADDDNVYSIELFESMRLISRFGTWPVAMVAEGKNKAILEGPVCNATHVIGWHTNERSRRLRRFHVDMSGFAFNSTILWDADTWPRPTRTPIRQLETVKEGFQETTFIEQVVEDESQMEAVPAGCSRILNWHLHFEAHYLPYPSRWSLLKNLAPLLPFRS